MFSSSNPYLQEQLHVMLHYNSTNTSSLIKKQPYLSYFPPVISYSSVKVRRVAACGSWLNLCSVYKQGPHQAALAAEAS